MAAESQETSAQETTFQEASVQETESQETFALAASYQLTPSKTGSESPLGSETRNLSSALFGLGGMSILDAFTIWISPGRQCGSPPQPGRSFHRFC